jgi:hypothetical protein
LRLKKQLLCHLGRLLSRAFHLGDVVTQRVALLEAGED